MAATKVVAQHFPYNRTMALGILYSGISLGSMFFPLLFRAIVPVYTVRGMFMVLSGLKLNYLVVALLFYAARHEKMVESINTEDEPLISKVRHRGTDSSYAAGHTQGDYFSCLTTCFRAFCTLKCLALCLWSFTFIYALFGYVMFFPLYAEELILTEFKMETLLCVFGASDFVGKIVIGFLAGLPCVSIHTLTSVNLIIVGILTIFLPSILVNGLVYYVCIFHMALVGFCAGGLYGLLGAFVVDAVGVDKAGTAMGLVEVCFGLALLLPSNLYGELIKAIY